MNRTLLTVCFVLACAVILQAQTPTITAVYGEAGTTSPLCPGGIAFVEGTNLGGNGTAVTVGTRQAYVVNAFGGRSLQIQLPVDAPLGPTTLKAGISAPFNITLVQYSPGLSVNGPGSLAFAPQAQCFEHFRHARQIPGRVQLQFRGRTFRRRLAGRPERISLLKTPP